LDGGRTASPQSRSPGRGEDPGTLLAPAVGLVLLAFYAAAVALAGSLAISRRDVG